MQVLEIREGIKISLDKRSDHYNYSYDRLPCEVIINGTPTGVEIKQGDTFNFCADLEALLKKYAI